MTKRKTSWRKVEEEICGRLKNNSRLIDADKLIQAFEVEEKQANDEIRVGDEVECPQIDGKGIVINKANKDTLLILSVNMDGLLRTEENKVHKTGKHFDSVSHLMEEIKDENN